MRYDCTFVQLQGVIVILGDVVEVVVGSRAQPLRQRCGELGLNW